MYGEKSLGIVAWDFTKNIFTFFSVQTLIRGVVMQHIRPWPWVDIIQRNFWKCSKLSLPIIKSAEGRKYFSILGHRWQVTLFSFFYLQKASLWTGMFVCLFVCVGHKKIQEKKEYRNDVTHECTSPLVTTCEKILPLQNLTSASTESGFFDSCTLFLWHILGCNGVWIVMNAIWCGVWDKSPLPKFGQTGIF